MLNNFPLFLFLSSPDTSQLKQGDFAEEIVVQSQARRIASERLQVRMLFKPSSSVKERSRQALLVISAFVKQYPPFFDGWKKKHNSLSIEFPVIKLRVFTRALASHGYEFIDFLIFIKPVEKDVVDISVLADGSFVMVGVYPYKTGQSVDDVFSSKIREEDLVLYLKQVFVPELFKYLEGRKL